MALQDGAKAARRFSNAHVPQRSPVAFRQIIAADAEVVPAVIAVVTPELTPSLVDGDDIRLFVEYSDLPGQSFECPLGQAMRRVEQNWQSAERL